MKVYSTHTILQHQFFPSFFSMIVYNYLRCILKVLSKFHRQRIVLYFRTTLLQHLIFNFLLLEDFTHNAS